jgi:hypothetical protein
MDTAGRKKSSVKKATLVRDKLSQFSYTKKKDPKVPFGLGPDSAPLLSEILEDDKSLTESVVSLMAQAKAEGTITTYECAVKRFKDFCLEKGYDYPKIGEKAVLHYIIQQNKDGASMAVLNQIKPAIRSQMECLYGNGGCDAVGGEAQGGRDEAGNEKSVPASKRHFTHVVSGLFLARRQRPELGGPGEVEDFCARHSDLLHVLPL